MKILGASIGSCVHTVGLLNFLDLAKQNGFEVIYLGAAIPVDKVVAAIEKENPELVALSYRLSAEPLRNLLTELEKTLKKKQLLNRTYVFGGTFEAANEAKKFEFINKTFDGSEEIEDIIMFLRGTSVGKRKEQVFPQTLGERIKFKSPFPLVRHHIGLESVEKTAREIEKMAESELLDVISIAPDQNCQQHFFDPENMDHSQDGAGGVPLRRKEDFELLYKASRRGNYPLVRCYAGTSHMTEFSKLLKETINNAWAAVPLWWYSKLDRRSERPLLAAIEENIKAIQWNAQNNVPVEINDSHQWALRRCHDSLEVATAYIAAYIAKALGVREYVQQFMLETPSGLSPRGDIAKMLAKKELIESLQNSDFRVYRMIRTGLLSMPADPYSAMGQLSSSMFYGWLLKPHIIHVVAYCESMERATSKEIIESVKMSRRAVNMAMRGFVDPSTDPWINTQKNRIKDEALMIVEAVKNLKNGKDDDLLEKDVLYKAVESGILDAPALKNFSVAKGAVKTAVVDGCCRCVDDKGNVISEQDRLKQLTEHLC